MKLLRSIQAIKVDNISDRSLWNLISAVFFTPFKFYELDILICFNLSLKFIDFLDTKKY